MGHKALARQRAMGHKALARQRAMGIIGQGRVEKVEATPAAFVDRAEQERLMARRAELEAEVKRLRGEVAQGEAVGR